MLTIIVECSIFLLQAGYMKLSENFNLHNFLTNLNFTTKNYQNLHLNDVNSFCNKVQEVKGQRAVDLHSAQGAERRTLQGLNLIKNHSKKQI